MLRYQCNPAGGVILTASASSAAAPNMGPAMAMAMAPLAADAAPQPGDPVAYYKMVRACSVVPGVQKREDFNQCVDNKSEDGGFINVFVGNPDATSGTYVLGSDLWQDSTMLIPATLNGPVVFGRAPEDAGANLMYMCQLSGDTASCQMYGVQDEPKGTGAQKMLYLFERKPLPSS